MEEERRWGKSVGGWICVYSQYMCAYKFFKIPVETIPWVGKGDKGEWLRGEFKYDTFAILKDFCKCHNVPPTHHNNKK
jgi:hypothetical protein